MQESDGNAFERAFRRLCAAFNSPPTDVRKDAYFRAFRKLTLLEFAGLVDMALVDSAFASMPTVGALWDLYRKNSAPTESAVRRNVGPTLQEQLCAYATLRWHSMLEPNEFSLPWTYVYREWIDHELAKNKEGKCAECIGVVIVRRDGSKIGISVSSMLADVEGHAKAVRSFQPGLSPRKAFAA